MPYQLEYTDTFGGEANYCWVNRAWIADREPVMSRRSLVRAAKAWAGLTGVRCDTSDMGDLVTIRPHSMATVLFVAWTEPEYVQGDEVQS